MMDSSLFLSVVPNSTYIHHLPHQWFHTEWSIIFEFEILDVYKILHPDLHMFGFLCMDEIIILFIFLEIMDVNW